MQPFSTDTALLAFTQATEEVVRACGKRYGLDDLEIRQPPHRSPTIDGGAGVDRREVWWTREDRIVGWCELTTTFDGQRIRYSIRSARPADAGSATFCSLPTGPDGAGGMRGEGMNEREWAEMVENARLVRADRIAATDEMFLALFDYCALLRARLVAAAPPWGYVDAMERAMAEEEEGGDNPRKTVD